MSELQYGGGRGSQRCLTGGRRGIYQARDKEDEIISTETNRNAVAGFRMESEDGGKEEM